MRTNHKQKFDRGQIKIFNGDIADYEHPTSEFTFVVGLEILDNMPHDRIWLDAEGSPAEISYIDIKERDGLEKLEEHRLPID